MTSLWHHLLFSQNWQSSASTTEDNIQLLSHSEREWASVRKRERERESGGSVPDFILTQSSFILFKQMRDSKTSEHTSQSCLCLSLPSSFGFNLIKKRAAGRGGRADAHLISGPSVCSAGCLPALYPTRLLHGKCRERRKDGGGPEPKRSDLAKESKQRQLSEFSFRCLFG